MPHRHGDGSDGHHRAASALCGGIVWYHRGRWSSRIASAVAEQAEVGTVPQEGWTAMAPAVCVAGTPVRPFQSRVITDVPVPLDCKRDGPARLITVRMGEMGARGEAVGLMDVTTVDPMAVTIDSLHAPRVRL
jgi:hypothetical protein